MAIEDVIVAGNSCLSQGPGGYYRPVVWDAQFVYWFLAQDNAIYRCNIPNCTNGPEVVATQVAVNKLLLVYDQLYWLDGIQGIMRTAKDGSSNPQRLTLEAQTHWASPLAPSQNSNDNPCFGEWSYNPPSAAVDGAYVYLARANYDTGALNITRWNYLEEESVKETIVDEGPNSEWGSRSGLYVLGGELWYDFPGGTWSCLADDCANTKRFIGRTVDNPVADDRYIYWMLSIDGNGKMRLERTPRLTQ